MKRILLSCLLILFIYTLKAQDTHLNDVVNTLKERISLAGYAQVGYTYDDAGEKASNTFDIKRVIFMARGKITDKWSCYFMYSFANTGKILEAYTEYQFLPQLTARIGQFKTMYTIENPMSPCFVELINCYSQAVNYLAGINGSDPLYGSNSGRDMGILIYGDLFKKKLSYNFAVMNGQGINLKDKNNQKDIVGSLMVHPLDWLSVGGSFIKGKGFAVADEQEGEAICRKMAEGINKESVRLLNHLSMRDCVVISATAFWCMIEVIIFLLAAFICTCMTNAEFIHSLMLWKVLGYSAGFLVVCVALTVFTYHKLKH